ncbi:hypothetical protein BZA70DRAFT_291949 [Myxozyma melibiosi]|uniref:MIT domain-containing protein n=1 Tax=Myxozyma melibiosi TaxID=54550 RepID=A0ABR1EYW9_9ASCO
MDEVTLQKAHSEATKADAAVLSRRPKDAISLYASAASMFESLQTSTKDDEARRMLLLLQQKYARLSAQIKTHLETNPEMFKKSSVGQQLHSVGSGASSSASALASSLASARGIAANDIDQHYVNVKHRSSRAASDLAPPSALAAAAMGHDGNDDLFTRFNSTIEICMTRLFHSSGKTVAAFDALRRQGGAGLDQYGTGMESFYVVPTSRKETAASSDPGESSTSSTGQPSATLVSEITSSLSAHETNLRKQRDVMRNNLGKLRMEIRARESRRTKELEGEIERLVAENEKLKISNGRLKTRWDNLMESARKRREVAAGADAAAADDDDGAESGDGVAEE